MKHIRPAPRGRVDLAFLRAPPPQRDLGDALERQRYVVQPRATIFEEDAFWSQTYGGFGGVHARPSALRSGPYGGGFHGGGFRGGGG